MRVFVSALCIVFFLVGCGNRNEPLNHAMELRNKFQSSNGCKFNAEISADYGDKIYQFLMECQVDKNGDLTFCVKEPVSISGITGVIRNEKGSIVFDDRVLGFQTIADEQITPVTAPWIMIKAHI